MQALLHVTDQDFFKRFLYKVELEGLDQVGVQDVKVWGKCAGWTRALEPGNVDFPLVGLRCQAPGNGAGHEVLCGPLLYSTWDGFAMRRTLNFRRWSFYPLGVSP